MTLDVEQRERMTLEHDAWLKVVAELRAAGAGAINDGEEYQSLHDAIALWGEELAQLRMHDPNPKHAAEALASRRAKCRRARYGQ